MYFVVYKCTVNERNGKYGHSEKLEMNSYYVANHMYSTREEAKKYASSIAYTRQPRVVKCVDFMCPSDGHWQEVK